MIFIVWKNFDVESYIINTLYLDREGTLVNTKNLYFCKLNTLFCYIYFRKLNRDIVATNGVIHVVEDVLLPDSAKTSLLDSVKSRSKFLAEMIEKSGKVNF